MAHYPAIAAPFSPVPALHSGYPVSRCVFDLQVLILLAMHSPAKPADDVRLPGAGAGFRRLLKSLHDRPLLAEPL